MTTPADSDADAAERAYWTKSMEEAIAFMEQMRRYPIEECGEPMASLIEAADGLEVQFSTSKINHIHPRVFFCREGLIEGFRAIARAMNDRGWVLKVEDGYRSPEMQRAQSHNPRHFDLILKNTIWELGGAIPDPELMLRRMGAIIALRARVGTHVSGSAIDISVFDRETGAEIERGGPYIEISARTPMASPFISANQKKNREAIQALMASHGWIAYPWEFWHFSRNDSYAESLLNTGRAGRYGPIDFDGVSARPIPDPLSDQLLEPLEFYQKEIQSALLRLEKHDH
jgi:D-alanyl-D-alanine dipeptidase